MKKVNIILPAYNGEKYIGEQLESLLNQTYPLIDIYVRDDKSRDETVDVIRSYQGREPEGKRIILVDNGGVNWGYVRNVFDTWKLTAPADYYCFCDQDDVWHADKVEKSVALLESKGDDAPALCFTGFNYCDKDLNFLRPSEAVPKAMNLGSVCYDFYVLNFNICVNHALREQFFSHLPPNGQYPHYPDAWMAKMAAAQGRLFCVEEPLVKYRRNEQALSYANHSALTLFIWRFKRFVLGSETAKIREDLVNFQQAYSGVICPQDDRMMDIFNRHGAHWLHRIFYPARLRRAWKDELALRLMFLMRKV